MRAKFFGKHVKNKNVLSSCQKFFGVSVTLAPFQESLLIRAFILGLTRPRGDARSSICIACKVLYRQQPQRNIKKTINQQTPGIKPV